MDETVRDQPVVLLVAVDRRWPQDQAVEQLPVVECQPRNDAGGDDDDECDRQVHRKVLPRCGEGRGSGQLRSWSFSGMRLGYPAHAAPAKNATNAKKTNSNNAP